MVSFSLLDFGGVYLGFVACGLDLDLLDLFALGLGYFVITLGFGLFAVFGI